jgi:hypothetical protein
MLDKKMAESLAAKPIGTTTDRASLLLQELIDAQREIGELRRGLSQVCVVAWLALALAGAVLVGMLLP